MSFNDIFNVGLLNSENIKNINLSDENFKKNKLKVENKLTEHFKTQNPKNLFNKDVEFLFNLIDEVYFNSLLSYNLNEKGYNISFKSSKKLTSSAGIFKVNKNCKLMSIQLSNKILLEEINEEKETSGLKCNNIVQAIIITMEHEMTHLIMTLFEIGIGHDKNFKLFVRKIFGHTKCTHKLKGKYNIVDVKDLKVGCFIYFNDGKNKGVILKINKVNLKVLEVEKKIIYNVKKETVHSISNEQMQNDVPNNEIKFRVNSIINFGDKRGTVIKINKVNVIVKVDEKLYNVKKLAISSVEEY